MNLMNENHLMMYFNNVGDVEGPPPPKKKTSQEMNRKHGRNGETLKWGGILRQDIPVFKKL